MAVADSQVIDLTDEPDTRAVSPAAPDVIVIGSDSELEVAEVEVKDSNGDSDTKKPRKKKKKKKTLLSDDGDSRRRGREDATDRGEGPSSGRQDEGSSPRKRKRSPTPPNDDQQLFYIDLEPVAVHHRAAPAIAVNDAAAASSQEVKLLLPSHVQVFGSVPVEIIAPVDEDQDFIDYLDYDSNNRKGVARYYQDPEEKPVVKTKSVCKNCGAEGDHTTYHCPVIICLTCGARDEHITRSCPISKNCFTCGMKGHVSSSCPNRNSYQRGGASYLCQRCGQESHLTSECPTWWRLYAYVSEDDRAKMIAYRKETSNLPLGQGGEGFIAEDEWCYNCGLSGHWGDSCDTSRPHGVPDDGSAFHPRNVFSGPYSESVSVTVARRDFRDWEKDDTFVVNAGHAGKQKARQKLQKSEQKQRAAEDQEHSWFDNQHRRGQTAPARQGGHNNNKETKKMAIRIGEQFMHPPSGSGLMSRISDGPGGKSDNTYPSRQSRDRDRDRDKSRGHGGKQGRGRQSDPYSYDSGRSSRRDRDRDDSYNRDRSRDHRPRYSGGYSR